VKTPTRSYTTADDLTRFRLSHRLSGEYARRERPRSVTVAVSQCHAAPDTPARGLRVRGVCHATVPRHEWSLSLARFDWRNRSNGRSVFPVMNHPRIIPALLATLTVGAVMAIASSAQAAYFSFVPPLYSNDGAGPFYYSFESSSAASGPYGWVAYKLSTEPDWHRCLYTGRVTLSNLPDGVYSITISDDFNVENYAARGQYDVPGGCSGEPPAGFARSSHSFYVDTLPPLVGVPAVTTNDKTTQITVAASDESTGIDHFDWSLGDGALLRTASPSIRYTYLTYGGYSGTVTATDRGGNTSSAAFRVELKAPGTLGLPPRGSAGTNLDTSPPNFALSARSTQRVLRQGGVIVYGSCEEPCRLTALGTLSVPNASKVFRLGRAVRSVSAHTRAKLKLRLSGNALRAAGRALKRRGRIVARVTVRATDRDGNARSARRKISLRR
jgi:hypothetical protein